MISALTGPVWGLLPEEPHDSEQHCSLWVVGGKECLVCRELSDKHTCGHKAEMTFVKLVCTKQSHIDCVYIQARISSAQFTV